MWVEPALKEEDGLSCLRAAQQKKPTQKNCFDEPQFINALQKARFQIKASLQMAELYLWVVAQKT